MIKKKFGLTGYNGLYLVNVPDFTSLTSTNYASVFIEDYDFYPTDLSSANKFVKTNMSYSNNMFVGSNALSLSNSDLKYSELKRDDLLILYEKYFLKFDVHFKFSGSAIPSDYIGGSNLKKLKVKAFADFGNNLKQLYLEDLYKYNTVDAIYNIPITGDTYWDLTYNVGMRLNNNVLELGYKQIGDLGSHGGPTFFEDYKDAPNGYNFKMSVRINENDLPKALGNKSLKIIIKYLDYADGVTERMATSYIYTQTASPSGGGPVLGPNSVTLVPVGF
jgi:hypothetical protein